MQYTSYYLFIYFMNVAMVNFFFRTAGIEYGPNLHIQGCIQKFPDWLLGVRTANGTALCH
jgi:hypothetical protein